MKSTLESGHNFKVETTEFPDVLEVGYGTEKSGIFALRNLPSTLRGKALDGVGTRQHTV